MTKHDERAFPLPDFVDQHGQVQWGSGSPGMSLWDCFAAHALSCAAIPGPPDHAATHAAMVADAMMAERSKREGR